MTSWKALTCLVALAVTVSGCDGQRLGTLRDPLETAQTVIDAPAPVTTAPSASVAQTDLIRQERRRQAARGFIRRAGPVPISPSTPSLSDDAAGGGDISLDFQGADLASVVQVMLEEGLGASYVLSPAVSGTVTLRTSRPLRRSEILPTLEEILRLNNAAIVEQGGVFRILPRAEAGLSAPVVSFRDVTARGMTVTVTPLRFVTVDDIAPVLDSFAPVAGAIRYDRARNIVFSIGTRAEQVTIANVIQTLDVNYFAGRSFALAPLREADAQAVTDELSSLFATPAGTANPSIRFLAIQRIGAVMVVADQQGLLDEALNLIKFLDQGAGETPRLRVFQVAHRRASDLANILGEIFNVATVQPGAAAPPSGTAFRSDATSALAPGLTATTTGDGAGGATDDPAAAGLTPPSGTGAALAAPRAAALPGAQTGRAGVQRIVADEASNTIVALATASGADALQNALRRLDVQPLQVMIEATLIEVTLNDQLEFGVRWAIESGNFSFSFGDVIAGVVNAGAGNLFPGFNAAFRTSDAQTTISALDAITDVRMLSAPTLMVLDNQAARLQVGDQVPITTRSSQSVTDPDAPIVEETEFRDTGVILDIRPTVNAGGLVVLGIRQEVSAVVATAADADNPTFAQRVVESTISVQSGETIALAGLIEEDATNSRQGIPVLSSIPVIGPAFGVNTDSNSRTELLILIRPIVIRDQSGAQAATSELRRKLEGLAPRPPAVSIVPGG
ncbi:MAG: type II secretion system secretin GspD [Pseudomonadota bacterium]